MSGLVGSSASIRSGREEIGDLGESWEFRVVSVRQRLPRLAASDTVSTLWGRLFVPLFVWLLAE